MGAVGLDNLNEMDFSFVRDEIYNLKDIPREFDEDLYLKFGVSRTVINYWRQIGFIPSNYHLFWIFYDNRTLFGFEEYRTIRDALISQVCKENEKIGNALRSYAINEDEVYEDFIRNDGDHMYFLFEEYDDRSEETLMASVYYDKIINEMKKEIIDKGCSLDVEYYITKYPMLTSEGTNQVIGIDIENGCGQFQFDSEGVHRYMTGMKNFPYEYMDATDLLDPYILFPHPFKVGDLVKFNYHREDTYGVLYYAAEKDERFEENYRLIPPDRTSFFTTIITIYKSEIKEGYGTGHNHICPLYIDKVDEDENLDENLKFLLLQSSKIIKDDKDVIFDWLPSYLKRYNGNIRTRGERM